MGFRISVTIYILIILLLAIIKPSFIYNHTKKEYVKINKNITLFQALAVALAIVCAVIFNEKNNIVLPNQTIPNIQYIPIPMNYIK